MTTNTRNHYRTAGAESGLGPFAIAVGGNGVAALVFGRTRDDARTRLAEALPDAQFEPADEALAPILRAATALIDHPGNANTLPLELDGSRIELAVWAALCAIPAGETRSYGAIAKTLPVAATAQEVGAACAANRIAVAIPCHRVVKADGSIAGYRWGVHRKRQLLAMKRAA